jgi:hypothetical protein
MVPRAAIAHDRTMTSTRRSLSVAACVLGPISIPVFLCLVALTANSCGMFADGCDTYGQPAPGFGWFLAGLLLGPVVTVAGIVSLAIGGRRRAA